MGFKISPDTNLQTRVGLPLEVLAEVDRVTGFGKPEQDPINSVYLPGAIFGLPGNEPELMDSILAQRLDSQRKPMRFFLVRGRRQEGHARDSLLVTASIYQLGYHRLHLPRASWS
ncbi:hypothetical protein PF011_g2760 [Phytophthora fragariae]|uniref:Uncharacterized protein n=1 Tax=Phytophthora fragariae TaxID=53985 RepID=A0A6A3M6I2_9STRA|nr:hypothetical protein PF003_g29526 [Phytophthora fragariae]KAE8886451.1 hypothetical protein PF003_g29521 [Phytophthora fragariae]KAE9025998.1 hypothetical protein PF011_g2760 [Phytophthora fragariae]